jgi:hypothetical protein
MNVAETAKDILLKVKALFDAPIVAPVAAAPVAPAAPVVTGVPFKLKDGTEITIAVKDTVTNAPAVTDTVTIAGAPAPAGDYELEDGSKITVDATGAISVVTPIQPVTQTPEQMAAEAARVAALAQPTVLTAEAVQAMYAKFATGTAEERLSNLEIMIKALMDSNFGYQIRQGQENAAIQAYKDSLAPMQAATATQLQAAEQKITKNDEVIKGLFELVEKLAELPSAEPKTLTGAKKDQYERAKAKEDKLTGIANAITALKSKNK